MPLSNPLATTGTSALRSGYSIPSTAIDPAAVALTFSWDITNHLNGNLASIHMDAQISMDNGVTFNPLCSGTRSQGFSNPIDKNGNPITAASVSAPILNVGSTTRTVKATLLMSQNVTTNLTITQS